MGRQRLVASHHDLADLQRPSLGGSVRCDSLKAKPISASRFWLTRDVVGQNAGEKITSFDASETNPLEKHCQLTWCVEMSYSVREITNTFLALGRTPENHCREPYRELQIDQVW